LVQLLGDADILSFVWISLLYWIGYVNRMGNKSTVGQVFNNNPQGSRIRRRLNNRWWNFLQTDFNKCKITNWNERSKNKADWEKSIKKAKVRIVLSCHIMITIIKVRLRTLFINSCEVFNEKLIYCLSYEHIFRRVHTITKSGY